MSVIFANESREAERPFLGDLLVVAFFAAAKEITSVGHMGHYCRSECDEIVHENSRTMYEERYLTPPLYSGRTPRRPQYEGRVIWERKEQL